MAESHVPNLDAMSLDDLSAFYAKYAHPSLKAAEFIVGDRRKGFTVIVARLAAYAINKSVAMSCRGKGQIQAAQTYEKICEEIYERIPKDLRW
jgi:hypothetical protein